MEMAVGAMLGYCATGNARIDRPPPNMIAMAMTQAKMGWSMKNFDMGLGGGDRLDDRYRVLAVFGVPD